MWEVNFIFFNNILLRPIVRTFWITQNLELYIIWKLMEFLTTYVLDVYQQNVVLKLLAILFHNWHIFILFLKFPLSGQLPEQQVPDNKYIDFICNETLEISLACHLIYKGLFVYIEQGNGAGKQDGIRFIPWVYMRIVSRRFDSCNREGS